MTSSSNPGEVELEERDIVGLLRPYVNFREDAKVAELAQKRTGETIKAWLLAHGGVKDGRVRDGEAGITAKLNDRASRVAYDLETILNQDRPLMLELVRLGILQINVTALNDYGGSEIKDRLEPHVLPALMTPTLDVREDKAS